MTNEQREAYEAIEGNECVKRGIEIALAGDHSICFLSPTENLVNLLSRFGKSAYSCPCGGFGTPYIECTCDDDTLAEHYETLKESFKKEEMFAQSINDIDIGSSESADEVEERIQNMGEKPEELGGDCQSIIDMMVQEHNITEEEKGRVIDIASTIAALEHDSVIQPHYLAEAFQYDKRIACRWLK